MKTSESVVDFPRETLCPEIWDKVIAADGATETYALKSNVEDAIRSVANNVLAKVRQQMSVELDILHITGSITSNSYTENSDIDLHLLATNLTADDNQAEQINKAVRAAYQTKTFVGKHPIEVYFQSNQFQDMMSVGCYDVNARQWIVGPEFTDQTFNPYSEYYKAIQAKSASIVQQIRNMILSIYEMAVVLKKNIGTDFQTEARQQLVSKLKEVQTLYDNIRKMRKAYSSPKSAEEALKFRSSRKWKIADGAFKMFDKYGYTAILKEFIEISDLISSSTDIDEEASEKLLSVVKDYINNADKLSEKDGSEDIQLDEDESLNEGKISNILLAILLAVPGFLTAKEIQKSIDTQPTYKYIVNDVNANCKKIGQYTVFQAANIIARTIYAEARKDGKDGMEAVASVIYHRADGKVKDFVNACKKHSYSRKAKKQIYQFSCWNKMTDSEWLPDEYEVKLPSSVKTGTTEQKMWEAAMSITADMLANGFKPTVDATMYYNPDKASPKWKDELTDKKTIGSHIFGKLKHHSPFL